jgi:gas vesicle protein
MGKFNKAKTFVSSFAIGGLIGGLAGLLMAPKSGMEMREDIRTKGIEIKDMVGENVQNTRVQAERAIDNVAQQAKDKAERLRKVGEKTYHEQKSSIEKGADEAQNVIQS